MVNYYNKLDKKHKGQQLPNPNYKEQHMFEVPFRMLICAPSGSGKTNTLLDIMNRLGSIFKNIHICVKSKDEPLYNYLDDKVKGIKFYEGDKYIYSPNGKKVKVPNTPDMKDINDKDENKEWEPSLVVFDDLALDKNQSNIEQLYIRGRKRCISTIYLSQGYYKTPKVVRDNCSYIILKKGITPRDLKRLMNDYVLGFSPDELMKLYAKFTTGDIDKFLLLDLKHSKVYDTFSKEPACISHIADDDKLIDLDEAEDYRNEKINEAHKNKRELAKQSMELFLNYLKGNGVEGSYTFPDIWDVYNDWVEQSGAYKAPKNTFSRTLHGYCPRFKKGRSVYYVL